MNSPPFSSTVVLCSSSIYVIPLLPRTSPLTPTANRRVVQQPRQLLQPERRPQLLPAVLHHPAPVAHQPEGIALRGGEPVPREAHGLHHFHPFLVLLIRLQRQHQQRQQHRHGRGRDPGHQSLPQPIHKHGGWAHGAAAHPHPAAEIRVVLSSKEVSAANASVSLSFPSLSDTISSYLRRFAFLISVSDRCYGFLDGPLTRRA